MSEKKETFHYTYSASQREEVQRIREKYQPKEESKLERLRKLDASATTPGTAAALTVGAAGTLVFGVGMCCTLVWADTLFVPGVIIGVVGIAGMIAAYPLYTYITKKRREKLAPEIMRLTDELMQ